MERPGGGTGSTATMMDRRRRHRRVGRPPELERIRAEEAALDGASEIARAELQLRKWRVIHRHVHAHPFHVSARLPRAEQWRRVLAHVQETLGEPEVSDWVAQQMDIAANRAAGIPDLRPRKDGPCHALLLEYVANRKRKALAVLHWVRAAAGGDGTIPGLAAGRIWGRR